MASVVGQFRRRLLQIPVKQTRFEDRGFSGGGGGMCHRIEVIGETFLVGYHAAIEEGCVEGVLSELAGVERELQGFAFEGAAMGLAFLDLLFPRHPSRFRCWLEGPGEAHAYMVHVGLGWLWARWPWKLHYEKWHLDPLLKWLAFDGYGFHEGYFHWARYGKERKAPRRLTGYQRRAFDQGLGRSLWFNHGGEVSSIGRTIGRFEGERQGDLWSGVGLAATYAGGVDEEALKQLLERAGRSAPCLAQGSAFAAKARVRAGNPTAMTRKATRILCGMEVEAAAEITDQELENLPHDGAQPAYEIWRRRVQGHFRSVAFWGDNLNSGPPWEHR